MKENGSHTWKGQTLEKKSSERSENQGPGDKRISGCSVVCSRVDILLSAGLYCSLHNRPINEEMALTWKASRMRRCVSPGAILPELEFRLFYTTMESSVGVCCQFLGARILCSCSCPGCLTTMFL